MLTLWGDATRRGYCDGLSRRSFLQVDELVMGGLSLPGLLEAKAVAAASTGKAGTAGRSAHHSVIMVSISRAAWRTRIPSTSRWTLHPAAG